MSNVIPFVATKSSYDAMYKTFAEKLKITITEHVLSGYVMDHATFNTCINDALDLVGECAHEIRKHHVVLHTLLGQARAWLHILNSACAFDMIGQFDIVIKHGFDDEDIIDFPAPRILFVLGNSDVILTIQHFSFLGESDQEFPHYSNNHEHNRFMPNVISAEPEEHAPEHYAVPAKTVFKLCDAFETFAAAKCGGVETHHNKELGIHDFSVQYAVSSSTFWNLNLTVKDKYLY